MTNVAGETPRGIKEQLSTLFGGYRAEWLGNKLFELFTEPEYLPELLTPRPCFLFGGRGTGKTTVLRGLSYEGQWALQSGSEPQSWPYYGFYLRVNTNRVRAFQGQELSEDEWKRTFAHYINLTLCEEALAFVNWLPLHGFEWPDLHAGPRRLVCDALHLKYVDDYREMLDALRESRVRFEAYINNVADGKPTDLQLTMLAQPIDLLLGELKELVPDRQFFFLVDEYENYSDYQQQVVNTVIKHAGAYYTFKVGLKELGLRVRTTLNPDEQLISPADYERIDIRDRLEGQTFATFAERVCNDRVRRVDAPKTLQDIRSALPGLSEPQEASLLGVETLVRDLREELLDKVADTDLRRFDAMAPLEAYLVRFWSDDRKKPIESVLREALEMPQEWRQRLENYQYAMLFTIRRKKRGLHKYYCGWETYLHLADGNIRYLLQLANESLVRNADDSNEFARAVSPETQTVAAQEVGKKNLLELEGLAVNGAHLTRLVLGLGRIFQVMARQAEGHTPEVNQFWLEDPPLSVDSEQALSSSAEDESIRDLLKSAVMHQALVRAPGTKLAADSAETKAFDYSIHPVFAAFFEYSHRRKRKMKLTPADVKGLVENPRSTISAVLARSRRTADEDLPEQLALFAPYFHAR